MRQLRQTSKPLTLPIALYKGDGGSLSVVEQHSTVPFEILRVFTISATGGTSRGHHAHKQCSQFLHCVHGEVTVACFDGQQEVEFSLNAGSEGLLIPPGIWAHQTYEGTSNILNVFCDLPYDDGDYIRDKDDYVTWLNERST